MLYIAFDLVFLYSPNFTVDNLRHDLVILTINNKISEIK